MDNENNKKDMKENNHYSYNDNNENKIKILEMQLKAIENLFSLQERILAENGLKASLEGVALQKQQKIVNNEIESKKEEGKMTGKNDTEKNDYIKHENNNEVGKTKFEENQKYCVSNNRICDNVIKIKNIENIEKVENTKNTGNKEVIEIVEKNIFKDLKLECFPYLRLLELWRKKCLCSVVERMRSEKVENDFIIF